MKLVFLLLIPLICFAQDANLKIISVNVWSGLDYEGLLKCGEYESDERREERFNFLAEQIRQLKPDILLMQEVNPAGGYSKRMANLLGYEEIHNTCNSGVKIAGIGIPVNLNEGLAILATPELKLKKYDIWKLSGPFGLYSGSITIHFSEAAFALVGKVLYQGHPLYIINTHLSDFIPTDSAYKARIMNSAASMGFGKESFEKAAVKWNERREKKKQEFDELESYIAQLDPSVPYILGGDFNCIPQEKMLSDFKSGVNIRECSDIKQDFLTWDPDHNSNAINSLSEANGNANLADAYSFFNSVKDKWGKRLDYIFLSPHFNGDEVKNYSVVFDSVKNGIMASDHYGISSEVDMSRILNIIPEESEYFRPLNHTSIEPFPIAMYDSDIGFGYGAKAFFLNQLNLSESIDLLAFNSTKGERWYRFAFSIPDIEARQGKIYNLTLDITADYDKLIKNSFFGIGNGSEYNDREYYTKETLDLSISTMKGFTPDFYAGLGLRYKSSAGKNRTSSGKLNSMGNGSVSASAVSIFTSVRYDSRDSYINPSEGSVIQLDLESSPKLFNSNVKFVSTALSLQHYRILFYPKTVLASRLIIASLSGDIPFQMLLSLGGNRTLRGYSQDRFMDKSYFLFNGELRFPIIWRFGGLAGLDAGRVFSSLKHLSLHDYKYCLCAGLRFYLNNFVVRLDTGFSNESTGIYFNFGHIF